MENGALSRACWVGVVGLSLVVAGGCRRSTLRLEPVQEMAYRVKPGVVRVNAYATGEFEPDPAVLAGVAEALEPSSVRVLTPSVRVDTGAGGSGSGFIIHADGWVLTSDHVVAKVRDEAALGRELRRNGAIAALMQRVDVESLRALARARRLDGIVRELGDTGRLEGVIVVRLVELSNGESVPFVVERSSPGLDQGGDDLALLKVDRSGLPTVRLGDSGRVLVQEAIWVIGYPAVASTSDEVIGGWLSRDSDLEATFNPGSITALKSNASGTPLFQTDAPVYPGNSGGPAVDRLGNVIGVPTWGHTRAEGIRFLVPIELARPLIRAVGIDPLAESRFDRYYQQGLADAMRGDWRDARENLSIADGLFPGSPDLARFLRDADVALARLRWWEKNPEVVVLTTLLAAMALALAALRVNRGSMVPRSRRRSVAAVNRATTRGEHGSNATEIPVMLGRFTFLNGERAGQRLGLGGSGIRIGRESSMCDIVLSNPRVSRVHAEIVWADGGTLLIDKGSSNGTWVNDRRIDRTVLNDGDIIHFGGRNAVAVAYHA